MGCLMSKEGNESLIEIESNERNRFQEFMQTFQNFQHELRHEKSVRINKFFRMENYGENPKMYPVSYFIKIIKKIIEDEEFEYSHAEEIKKMWDEVGEIQDIYRKVGDEFETYPNHECGEFMNLSFVCVNHLVNCKVGFSFTILIRNATEMEKTLQRLIILEMSLTNFISKYKVINPKLFEDLDFIPAFLGIDFAY